MPMTAEEIVGNCGLNNNMKSLNNGKIILIAQFLVTKLLLKGRIIFFSKPVCYQEATIRSGTN
jgi:hypothetical protein